MSNSTNKPYISSNLDPTVQTYVDISPLHPIYVDIDYPSHFKCSVILKGKRFSTDKPYISEARGVMVNGESRIFGLILPEDIYIDTITAVGPCLITTVYAITDRYTPPTATGIISVNSSFTFKGGECIQVTLCCIQQLWVPKD